MKNIFHILLFSLLLITSCKNNESPKLLGAAVVPNVVARFANPAFINGYYEVDAQVKSDVPGMQLFGMNVRFCYDASVFTDEVSLVNFVNGYGVNTFGQPQVFTANAASKVILGFNGAVRFANGAMQLVDKNAPAIYLNSWTTLFKVRLKPVVVLNQNLCQSLVWDKMSNPSLGGFLQGSDGLTITVVAPPGSRYESAESTEYAEQFNWEYTGSGIKYKYPYGRIVPCN